METARWLLILSFSSVKVISVTNKKELEPGIVEGHDIEILDFEEGQIIFKVNKIVDEGYTWTGIINNIEFNGNITGGTTLTYTVECEKDAF